MKNLCGIAAATLVWGWLLLAGSARADDEKVPLDKLPKAVVDAVNAKFPKGVLKHATTYKNDGKVMYEVGVNVTKDEHVHAIVTAAGKLVEIHQDIDPKDLPDKVAKAVSAKYPKAKIEEAEKQTDAAGKVLGYEVVVELNATMIVILQIDAAGKIRKEMKQTIKKDAK